jgi:periplasmic protein TonB
MNAETLPLVSDDRESLRGSILASVVLHAVLAGVALGYSLIQFRRGEGWGNPWEEGSNAHVNAVTSLPGVPLPAPLLATPNTVANQNPGLYQTEPQAPPPDQAEEIQKFKDTVKPEQPQRINKRIQKQVLTPPPNAVPFGVGGQPAMSYSEFATSGGSLGIAFGEGAFGSRYGWYVEAVRNRISSNWLLSTISPNVMTAPRLYVEFDIQKDGNISNIRLTQGSGNPEVDRSALRAIQAANPLGPLPPEYSGNQIAVSFYFDFRRQ